MKKHIMPVAVLSALLCTEGLAQQTEQYDYWAPQRAMIHCGQQVVFMCNGLFTSQCTLEQVFNKELAFLREPTGTAEGGDYHVYWATTPLMQSSPAKRCWIA